MQNTTQDFADIMIVEELNKGLPAHVSRQPMLAANSSSQVQLSHVDRLQQLAARENTVIDNPYQSSFIRQNWSRTSTSMPPHRVPVLQQSNLFPKEEL